MGSLRDSTKEEKNLAPRNEKKIQYKKKNNYRKEDEQVFTMV